MKRQVGDRTSVWSLKVGITHEVLRSKKFVYGCEFCSRPVVVAEKAPQLMFKPHRENVDTSTDSQ